MPKYKMPEKEHNPRHAFQVVADELMIDGNSRLNLATPRATARASVSSRAAWLYNAPCGFTCVRCEPWARANAATAPTW